MKAKQIEKLLKGMIHNLCDSIQDEEIINIVKNRTYITGGCIPSMLLDEFVNDFDIYFYDRKDANKIKEYYSQKEINNNKKFHVKLITDNSINLSDKIQFIIKFTGTPEQIINSFDWQHIKSYYIYPDNLILKEDIYKLIVEKELIYTGSQYPISSLMRLKKFIKKGFFVSNITILNIALDIIQAFYNPDKPYLQNNIINEKIYNDTEYKHEFSVDEILYHLNGVDPLTIQVELENQTGKYLPIIKIINLLNNQANQR